MKMLIMDQIIGLIVISLFLLIPLAIFFLLKKYSLGIRLGASLGTFLFLSFFSFFLIVGALDFDFPLLEEIPQKRLEFTLGSDISVLIAMDSLESESEIAPSKQEIYEKDREKIFAKISQAVSKWGPKTLVVLESIKAKKEKEGSFDPKYQRAYEEVRNFVISELVQEAE